MCFREVTERVGRCKERGLLKNWRKKIDPTWVYRGSAQRWGWGKARGFGKGVMQSNLHVWMEDSNSGAARVLGPREAWGRRPARRIIQSSRSGVLVAPMQDGDRASYRFEVSWGGKRSNWLDKEEVKDEAQASGLATGQILTQGMGLRKKRGLQGAVQVRTQVQLCNTELGETVAFVSRRLLWSSGKICGLGLGLATDTIYDIMKEMCVNKYTQGV